MERVKLGKEEKTVLRLLAGGCGCPDTYPRHVFVSCVDKLEMKGLAKGAWCEGHNPEAACITPRGKAYMAENPRLRNPVDWNMVSATIAVIGLIVSVVALFVACGRMWK